MEENYDYNSEEENLDEEAPEETENLEEQDEDAESDVDEDILADLQELDKEIGPIKPKASSGDESLESETSEDETFEDVTSENETFEDVTPEDEIASEDIEDEVEIGGNALDPEEILGESFKDSIEEGFEEGKEEIFEEGLNEGGEVAEEIDSNIEGESEFGIEESSGGENNEEIAQFSQEEKLSEEVDSHSRLKNVVEGALFVAGRPVSIEELNAKTNIGKRDLMSLLEELSMDYLVRSTALELVAVQDNFSLQIKPEYTPSVKKFASGGLIPDRILKTLTIIALKQPLMKSMLVKLRGATAYEHVKFLIDRGYIDARKKGRSQELMTTDQFAETFGLSRDIPTLKKEMIMQLELQDG